MALENLLCTVAVTLFTSEKSFGGKLVLLSEQKSIFCELKVALWNYTGYYVFCMIDIFTERKRSLDLVATLAEGLPVPTTGGFEVSPIGCLLQGPAPLILKQLANFIFSRA